MIRHHHKMPALQVAPPLFQMMDHSQHLLLDCTPLLLNVRHFPALESDRSVLLQKHCTNAIAARITHHGKLRVIIRQFEARRRRQGFLNLIESSLALRSPIEHRILPEHICQGCQQLGESLHKLSKVLCEAHKLSASANASGHWPFLDQPDLITIRFNASSRDNMPQELDL